MCKPGGCGRYLLSAEPNKRGFRSWVFRIGSSFSDFVIEHPAGISSCPGIELPLSSFDHEDNESRLEETLVFGFIHILHLDPD